MRLAELLVQIDGANSQAESEDEKGKPAPLKPVIVLAASNYPWDLDDAIIRRLEKRIYIPLPDVKGRKKMFDIKTNDLNLDKNIIWDTLVNKTKGYSGADIENVCRDAAFMPLNKVSFAGDWKKKIEYLKENEENVTEMPITQSYFEEA